VRSRLPLVLSSMALVIAIFGSTPFGRAAIATAVPLAKRAYLADTAKNAIKVDNIKASRTPTPGMLLPLDATGKLPESVGAVGPKGDKGDNGATRTVVRSKVDDSASNLSQVTVKCASGERATGGGFATPSTYTAAIWASFPSNNGVPEPGKSATAWTVRAYDPVDESYTLSAFVICSSP
jgi:hypothetical protein